MRSLNECGVEFGQLYRAQLSRLEKREDYAAAGVRGGGREAPAPEPPRRVVPPGFGTSRQPRGEDEL